jgi:hypothetical protein
LHFFCLFFLHLSDREHSHFSTVPLFSSAFRITSWPSPFGYLRSLPCKPRQV